VLVPDAYEARRRRQETAPVMGEGNGSGGDAARAAERSVPHTTASSDLTAAGPSRRVGARCVAARSRMARRPAERSHAGFAAARP